MEQNSKRLKVSSNLSFKSFLLLFTLNALFVVTFFFAAYIWLNRDTKLLTDKNPQIERTEITDRYTDGEKRTVCTFRGNGKKEIILKKTIYGFTYNELRNMPYRSGVKVADELNDLNVYFHEMTNTVIEYNNEVKDNQMRKMMKYDPYGDKIFEAEFQNGFFKFYEEYELNKLSRSAHFYSSGRKKEYTAYNEKGEKQSISRYHENGQLSYEMFLDYKGVKNESYYDENGNEIRY